MSVSINVPLNDLVQTVERPVIFGIIRDIQDATQISRKTQIRFYGEDARAMQYNSGISQDEESDNLWPHTPNLTIEVDEDHDPDEMFSMTVKQNNHIPVFEDEALGIKITPAYSSTLVRINFIYKATDKNEALKWRNEIRTRFAMLRECIMHDITYSWHVPEVYIAILKKIHELRENVDGYGDTFPDYLNKHFTSKATYVTNLAATQTALVIGEKATGIQGVFDFEGMPEKSQKEDEPNLYATSFSYQFRYAKPIEAVMVYPVSVHQQPIPALYRYDGESYNYQAKLKQFSAAGRALNYFEVEQSDLRYRSNLGLSIPWYDNFTPAVTTPGTIRVADILTYITPQDKRTLFNLQELGDYNLRPEVIAFLKAGEWRYITTPLLSIFELHYYEDRWLKGSDRVLSVDADLNVVAKHDLDLRKQHRIRICLNANPYHLPQVTLRRLKANQKAAIVLLTAINQAIGTLGNTKQYTGSLLPQSFLHGMGLSYARDGRRIVPANTKDAVGFDVYGNFGFNIGLVETLFVSTKPKQ